MVLSLSGLLLSATLPATEHLDEPAAGSVPTLQYRILAMHPHREEAFTQGLIVAGDWLYESSGGYGRSTLAQLRLGALRPQQELPLPDIYFAEGLASHNGRLYQLSWKAGKLFVYRQADLKPMEVLSYKGEGWGLASNGEQLISSDGSAVLSFRDPQDFTVQSTVVVREAGQPLARINELEWVRGLLYANVWQQERIVLIDPRDGQVQGSLPLTGLLPEVLRRKHTGVLNGIAYDPERDRLFVTGKRWPRLYQLCVLTMAGQPLAGCGRQH